MIDICIVCVAFTLRKVARTQAAQARTEGNKKHALKKAQLFNELLEKCSSNGNMKRHVRSEAPIDRH